MELDTGGAANGTPAPYGRACSNCARAKCRCIYRPEGADCERYAIDTHPHPRRRASIIYFARRSFRTQLAWFRGSMAPSLSKTGCSVSWLSSSAPGPAASPPGPGLSLDSPAAPLHVACFHGFLRFRR